MELNYGLKRVLEPRYVLPTSAWKVDNSRKIFDDEIRVEVKRIQLERTNFKQLCVEASYDEEKIKQKIMDIVIRRGKLHNPITDTGGLAFGIVDQIGDNYENNDNVKVGDSIVLNASLASLPMYIEKIIEIDYVYNQIVVTGFAIAHSRVPIILIDEKLPIKLLLFTLDESGTIFKLSKLVKDNRKFLVVGNNMFTNLIYGYAIRRATGPEGEIICVLDKKTGMILSGSGIDSLISTVFNQIHFLDILKPMECIEQLNLDTPFDLSVNCAEIPGAETINILSTKDEGTVLFANLINSLNIAIYITESISKNLDIYGAEGYIEGYEKYDRLIVKELEKYFQNLEAKNIRKNVENDPVSTQSRKNMIEQSLIEDFVCESLSMRRVLEDVLKVSKYDCNVIIFGETGVGKEKVANIIQKNSDRNMQPFLKINCGAIAPNLIEAEFFGTEKGYLSDSNTIGKKGYFEVANGGILFLDEIGELPLDMQAKFLRVIQDGEFYRVGGTTPIKTNVRLISATNRNLEEMVENGTFRRDLYYRLNVVPIRIPSLEKRPEDIPTLVNLFLERYGKEFDKKRGITDGAMEYLQTKKWPGNIRELENVIQRLVISSNAEDISINDIMKELNKDLFYGKIDGEESEINLDKAVSTYEKDLIKDALNKYGSTRKAANAIGISQTQLVRKKQKYGL